MKRRLTQPNYQNYSATLRRMPRHLVEAAVEHERVAAEQRRQQLELRGWSVPMDMVENVEPLLSSVDETSV